MKPLYVFWIKFQDPFIALQSHNQYSITHINFLFTYVLGCIQVFDVVDVNVPQQYQPFDVIWMILHQLIEEWGRLQRSVIVCQQQRKIEQCTAEIRFEVHRPSEPVLRILYVFVVHCQHAQVEMDPFVIDVLGE